MRQVTALPRRIHDETPILVRPQRTRRQSVRVYIHAMRITHVYRSLSKLSADCTEGYSRVPVLKRNHLVLASHFVKIIMKY